MRPRVILGLVLAAAVVWLLVHLTGWEQAVAWLLERQRLFHRGMAGELRGLAGGASAAAWGLVFLSFAYGIFHAAGPGHGKAVIATYLLTNESQVRRGLVLAAGSAFCQGLVAVALVHGLVLAAGWLPGNSQQAAMWAERASFLLLAGLGGLFAWRAARALVGHRGGDDGHHHHHHHQHGPECGCGHAPSPAQVARAATGWRDTAIVLLAVGLRPCSGAILVLALANVLGLEGAGIGAVAAMSAGTAVTVSALALLAVKARRWAALLAGRRGGATAVAGRWVALVGGLLILAMALSLLAASFGPAHPLRL